MELMFAIKLGKKSILYGSTNKNCRAGDLELVEFGCPNVDLGSPIFTYTIAYDTRKQVPQLYEKYSGSIEDIYQLQYMLDRSMAKATTKLDLSLIVTTSVSRTLRVCVNMAKTSSL